MRSTLPSDIRHSSFRLAVAAVIVGLAIPLLPLFGGDGLAFIFSQGLPVRFLIIYLLKWWATALVGVVGIWFLKRDRTGPAGGVFLAVGLGFTMLFLMIGRLALALVTGRGYPQRRRP